RFVRDCLHAWALAELDTPILLAVSELITIAVVHGSGPVDLAMEATGGRLHVTVTNQGNGTPVPRRRDPRDRTVGGWGLHVVDGIADEWGTDTEHGRISVWFDHALPG